MTTQNFGSSLAVSFFLTVLIFITGMLLNYYFDFFRIGQIEDVLVHHEIDTAAYRIEQDFVEETGGSYCIAMDRRIDDLKKEIRRVGSDLASYSSFSWFKKKDYDYLKRKYFLLQIKFYAVLKELSSKCDTPYVPILFFYKIDDVVSERQGFVLEDLSKEYSQVAVLALDKDYEDEPLVKLLVMKYNITTAPSIIIDAVKKEGYTYTGELNATIRNLLRRVDHYAIEKNFRYVPDAAGIEVVNWAQALLADVEKNISEFAKGDILLAVGRVTGNNSMICDSLSYFDAAESFSSGSELAVIYETSASVGCGRNRRAFLRAAADVWGAQNKTWRSMLYKQLADGRNPELKIIPADIAPKRSASHLKFSKVEIGSTRIRISENARVVTQVDRVTRDWLGRQLNQSPFGPNILNVMSERLKYNESDLQLDINWHEGGRIRNILSYINITVLPATSTLAVEKEGRWYASDESGVFRFEVPLDKVMYPTTRFLRDDLAVLVDTHGVNMLVDQAISEKADVVLSDCDHPGKVAAAEYLSNNGIQVICYPDKYVYLAIGHNLKLVGSPPFNWKDGMLTVGDRPVSITTKDRIVVVNATSLPYAIWYYQTPTLYFETISKVVPLNITYFTMTDYDPNDQQSNATKLAERINATILATRVYTKKDYDAVKFWLLGDAKRKAILFHSASYPAGMMLFNQFPNQTSFDDPNPVFR
ncbi:MAG: hypothetical protein HY363_03395 [Candidatus Aenigmarchaeota archaeon]|nr:hypothetical protein [Candidatus Aenigmarchaeota archaeon]